jgi:hypothetical protein
LPPGRLAALGATPAFHHGLLDSALMGYALSIAMPRRTG